MADFVNLRQARKVKERADKESRAQSNRLKYGRTKGDRLRAEHARKNLEAIVDGARREMEE